MCNIFILMYVTGKKLEDSGFTIKLPNNLSGN